MGHISHRATYNLVRGGFVDSIALESTEILQCDTCIFAKVTRKPVPKVHKGECAKEFGEQVHSDIWGPSPEPSTGGKRYFVTFTNNFSRLTHLFLLCAKSEAFMAYIQYESLIRNHLNTVIKIFHSDVGGEYVDEDFKTHL